MISSFKLILQKDSMQCGIAALAMVCRHYGSNYSLSFLEGICHATTEGVSMKGISDAAKELGLDCVCGKLPLKKLKKCPLPAILHWNQNHFVVLYKIVGDKFYIADPSKGKVTYVYEEFMEKWASCQTCCEPRGIAMLFEPTDKFGSVSDEGVGEKRSFRFLMGYLKKYRKQMIQILAGLLGS